VRRCDFSVLRSSGLDVTISEMAMPAPSRLQSCRKGRSVTPAMGATTRLLPMECEPMRTAENDGLKSTEICFGERLAHYTDFVIKQSA